MNNIQRIQTVSAIMQFFCCCVMLALPLALTWLWLNLGQLIPAMIRQTGLPLYVELIGPGTIALGLGCTLIPAVVLLYGIWRLYQLFGLYRQVLFFTEANARHLLVFALTLFVSVLLAPLVSALLSVILTWNNPPGQRALSMNLGSGQLAMLFIAGAFTVIAWIMLEGKKLADENAEIV